MKYLIVIVGPTAIGKTSLSIRVAQHYDCEIVSADSRQFFKEMRIGTAVPSAKELSAVKHHFIHNKSIEDDYTVGTFEKEAMQKLDELFKTNDFAILVGGSGLYIEAILKGLDEFPEIDPAIREFIAAKYEKSGISFLQKELKKRDPLYYETVDIANPQRLMRALEVCKTSGRPYSSFLNVKKNERPFIPIIIGIEAQRKVIYERINSRVDEMLEDGFVEEAKSLLPYQHLNALQTVGYREMFSHFAGDYSFDFAISEMKKNTRRFAKRQLTWFKKNDKIKWFDYETPDKPIIKYIKSVVKLEPWHGES